MHVMEMIVSSFAIKSSNTIFTLNVIGDVRIVYECWRIQTPEVQILTLHSLFKAVLWNTKSLDGVTEQVQEALAVASEATYIVCDSSWLFVGVQVGTILLS